MKKLNYHAYIQSPQWRMRRPFIMALMLGRDSICPLFKAHDCDHLTYRNLGREIPLRDCVPLNKYVHRWLITPLRSVLRFVLGRSTGNFFLAWLLRFCVVFWWSLPIRFILTVTGHD